MESLIFEDELKEEILQIRLELVQLVKNKDCLTDPLVVKKSEELDELIVKLQKIRFETN